MTDWPAFTDAWRGKSIADLHDRLGELVERLPGTALPRDRPGFGCSFNGIDPAPQVDMACADRLQLIAADARSEMGEERWAQLNADWNNPNFKGDRQDV